MNRAFYFVGGAAVALMSLFLVQSVGGTQQPDASVSSQFVAPNASSAAAPDSSSAAMDALAAWPAAAVR